MASNQNRRRDMSRQQKLKDCSIWVCSLFLTGWIATVDAHHVIVETDYVLKNKDKPGVILIDARAASAYKKGLIPGAVVFSDKSGAVALRDVDARILPVAKLEKILGEA